MPSIRRPWSLPEELLVRLLRLRNRWPPLFVVGAPRSGTTVVLQYVLAAFELGYFPNRAKKRPYACVAHALAGRLGSRFEPAWSSAYGVIEGPFAPSDGWDVFLRWFPEYAGEGPVDTGRLYELRNVVRLYEAIFRAPFANKNNANAGRIPHLAGLFPDALFLNVQRDLADTVLSLLEARARHGVPAGRWWGAAPPGHAGAPPESELELCVVQTRGVERAASEALARLPAGRAATFAYEDFCRDPRAVAAWVREAYAARGVALRSRGLELPESFTARSREFPDRTGRVAEIRAIVARLEARGA